MNIARVLLPCLLLVTGACHRQTATADTTPPPRAVRAVTVVQGPAEAPIVATGLLATRDEVQLGFKTGGVVHSVAVRSGDTVHAGQVLAQVELAEIDAGLAQAQASYEKSTRDLARGRKLFAEDVITREQLDDLGTAATVARAQLDAAEYNRGHAQIVAPGDGVVLRRMVEPGETVAPGQPVLSLSQSNSGHVLKLGLADRDIVRVQLGDHATVRFDAYPQRRFDATVIEIGHGADPRNGTFAVELEIADDPNAPKSLPSGLVGTASIVARGAGATRSYLPLTALVEGDQRAMTIFTLHGDVVHRQTVAVAFVADDRAALVDALPADTRVVTDGAAYLADGDTVRVVE
ncbi:efflux RND transporter periplasmic adaptor subunit [Solimonas terrae]|uniref:Efflux RND transporter periplasmic adaptor subunit n=1 Tax=Solimonas terrae TaxID=1396819 RepID=A0A6M2BT60_9GAMM|nr:efflux RND transporter periplasmic adaptor subunit [Solimonas terrae]NGY05157.1 efflux RND transporter periplasmic adaptor subunit [Solimonas terrae]